MLGPARHRRGLVHVRDYTKGHPSIEANNHPIRHGAVVGIHNGVIVNDDELLFERHGFVRAEPEMTVDSEAIFALVDAQPDDAKVLERLTGAMATAWLDERDATTLHLARGICRPLWIGRGKHEVFASTRAALEVVEDTCASDCSSVRSARGACSASSPVAGEERFRPDRSYRDEALPAVRAPDEGASCLERLAAIAAVA